MDAAADRSTAVNFAGTLPRLARSLIVVAAFLFALIAGLLLLRRLGDAVEGASPVVLLVAALAVIAIANLLRVARAASSPFVDCVPTASLPSALLTVAGIVMLSALTPTASPGWLTVAAWALFLTAEGIVWVVAVRASSSQPSSPSVDSISDHSDLALDATSEPITEPRPLLDENSSDHALQQLTRTRGEQGEDVLFGLLRGKFAAGERTQSLHVAVCPPMLTMPQCDVAQHSGVPAKITAAVVEPWGARFDVRLDQLIDQPCEVVVEFSMIADSS